MIKHVNDGNCFKCEQLFNLYPNFNPFLKQWFKNLQKEVPEAHISCAGRGRALQEQCFKEKTSRARYGQSAHNYNAAIDIFRLNDGVAKYQPIWYETYIEPRLLDSLTWGRDFKYNPEFPHVQLKDWKNKVATGKIKLVE